MVRGADDGPGSYWDPSLGHLFEDGSAQEMRGTFERIINEHANAQRDSEPFDWEDVEDDEFDDDEPDGIIITLTAHTIGLLMDAHESVEDHQCNEGLMFIGQFLDDLLRMIVTAATDGEADM